jgi:hypothetical protein
MPLWVDLTLDFVCGCFRADYVLQFGAKVRSFLKMVILARHVKNHHAVVELALLLAAWQP